MRRTPDPSPVIPLQRRASPTADTAQPRPGTRRPAAVPARSKHPAALPAEVRELRGLVHDLANGLSTMAMLLAAARDGAVPTFGLLEVVEQETARLLAVLHSSAPTGPPAPAAPVGVRFTVAPIARLVELAGRASVRVRPGPEVHVRVDPAVLSRVVSNLLDNAARAAGPAGTVELVVSGTGNAPVTIDVLDDGPGYPAGPPGSAGLGLDLVARLVAVCGGRLELTRLAPHGTRARVVLPVLPEPPTHPEAG